MTQHRLQTTARRDGTPRPSRIAAYLAGWRAACSAHRPTDRHYQVSGPAPRATPLVTRSLAPPTPGHAEQGRARPPTDGRTNGRCQLAGRREFSASRLLDCTSVKSVSGRSVRGPHPRPCARRRAGILNIALLATCSVRTYVVPVHAARSWRATRPPAAAPRGFCAVGATTTGRRPGPARSNSATTWHAQRAPPATPSDHPPVRHRTAPPCRQLKRYRTRTHPRRVLACLSTAAAAAAVMPRTLDHDRLGSRRLAIIYTSTHRRSRYSTIYFAHKI